MKSLEPLVARSPYDPVVTLRIELRDVGQRLHRLRDRNDRLDRLERVDLGMRRRQPGGDQVDHQPHGVDLLDVTRRERWNPRVARGVEFDEPAQLQFDERLADRAGVV